MGHCHNRSAACPTFVLYTSLDAAYNIQCIPRVHSSPASYNTKGTCHFSLSAVLLPALVFSVLVHLLVLPTPGTGRCQVVLYLWCTSCGIGLHIPHAPCPSPERRFTHCTPVFSQSSPHCHCTHIISGAIHTLVEGSFS